MRETILRRADPADALEVSKLLGRSIREICAPDYGNDEDVIHLWCQQRSPERIASWILDPSGYFVVIEDPLFHGIVACGLLLGPSLIKLCYVHPQRMGNGFGTGIMNRLEDEVGRWGQACVSLVSTLTALGFYQKRGYVVEQEKLALGKIRCFYMNKDLGR